MLQPNASDVPVDTLLANSSIACRNKVYIADLTLYPSRPRTWLSQGHHHSLSNLPSTRCQLPHRKRA